MKRREYRGARKFESPGPKRTPPKTVRDRSPEHVVTDHALIRYLERYHGMSFDALRDELLPPNDAALVKMIGTGSVRLASGIEVRVARGRIVTII